jgi:hypothetical protein
MRGSRTFDSHSRQSAGKGPAIKSATPSARLLRNFMKVAAGTSRLDRLRAAKIHHAPVKVEGIACPQDPR